jgi:hypothetical protein
VEDTFLGLRDAVGDSHCDLDRSPSKMVYTPAAPVARLTGLSLPSHRVAHCRTEAEAEEGGGDSHAKVLNLVCEDPDRIAHALSDQVVVDGHPEDVAEVQVERMEMDVVGMELLEEEGVVEGWHLRNSAMVLERGQAGDVSDPAAQCPS